MRGIEEMASYRLTAGDIVDLKERGKRGRGRGNVPREGY